MAKFSDNTITEIKSKLNIIDVVSEYVQITNKGNSYWIKCPFHGNGLERTPSCKLDLDRGTFYCFGCKEHGSIFDFVMKMENLEFSDALAILAKKAGVELIKMTKQDEDNKTKREVLNEIYSRIIKTFRYSLTETSDAAKAREYLLTRKISPEMQEKFSLGYAPASSTWLYKFLHDKQKYSDEILEISGFFSQKSYPYPLFSNRLMFPVRNWRGEVVAFGGRDLSFSDKSPKYLNTPETLIYSKKQNLFGIYESLETMKATKTAILCEGNFDVTSLHQAGFTNAVAPFGTAFTYEQAKLLSRYVTTVEILFDNDAAGQEATKKAIVILQQVGLETKVLELKGGKDPSDVLESGGEEVLRNSLIHSMNGFNYLVNNAVKKYNSRTAKGKTQILRELAPFLLSTNSSVEKEVYIHEISSLIRVSSDQINDDLKKVQTNTIIPQPKEEIKSEIVNRKIDTESISHDLYLMIFMANYREYFARYTKRLRFSSLKDKDAQLIYLALEDARREGVGETDEVFLQSLSDEQLRHDIATSFGLDEFRVEDPERVIDDLLDQLELRNLKDKRSLLNQQIRICEQEEAEKEAIDELLLEVREINAKIWQITNSRSEGQG